MRQGGRQRAARGFTLLEIIVAVTILAVFLLPMMLIISEAKIRAIRYTIQREVRDLAQRKLFDHIHYYEMASEGDFSLEGHPEWRWQVEPPEMLGGSEQVLLQYTIQLRIPQKLEGAGGTDGALAAAAPADPEGSSYEMSLWTLPDDRWYEEQEQIYQQGGYSPLYGDPRMPAGIPGGF